MLAGVIHHLGDGLFSDLIDVATSVSPRAASVQGGLVHSGCDPRPRVKGVSTLWQRKGRQAAPRLSLPSLWKKQPEGRRAAPRLWRCGRCDLRLTPSGIGTERSLALIVVLELPFSASTPMGASHPSRKAEAGIQQAI